MSKEKTEPSSPPSTDKRSPSGQKDGHNTDSRHKKDSIWTKLGAVVFPDWAKEGVKLPRTWKTFARCIVATLCTLVLLVDNKCA
jgi:hypothetical protein